VEGETYTVHYTPPTEEKNYQIFNLERKKKWKKNFFLHLVNFQTGTKELITMKVCD